MKERLHCVRDGELASWRVGVFALSLGRLATNIELAKTRILNLNLK